jgi:hypothetical protein
MSPPLLRLIRKKNKKRQQKKSLKRDLLLPNRRSWCNTCSILYGKPLRADYYGSARTCSGLSPDCRMAFHGGDISVLLYAVGNGLLPDILYKVL